VEKDVWFEGGGTYQLRRLSRSGQQCRDIKVPKDSSKQGRTLVTVETLKYQKTLKNLFGSILVLVET
jgi:hypothetical protein